MNGYWVSGRGKLALVGAALAIVFGGTNVMASVEQSAAARESSGTMMPVAAPMSVDVAQVDPIEVSPYRWQAEKSENGAVVISGYAPDAETQSALFGMSGPKGLDSSSLARGAPVGFADDARMALTILLALDEGSAALSGSDWQLRGMTDRPVAAAHVERLIAGAGLEADGWTIALSMPATDEEVTEVAAVESPVTDEVADDEAPEPETSTPDDEESAPEVAPEPAAMPFGFAVRKLDDSWLVGGNAPIAAFQSYLEAHFGVQTTGELVVAPAPEGFAATALAGLEVLDGMQNARLLFEDGQWQLTGTVTDDDAAEAARANLAQAGIAADVAVQPVMAEEVDDGDAMATPEVDSPPVAEPEPAATPFGFAVRKRDDSWLVGGNAPISAFQSYLEAHFGVQTTGELVVAPAPEGFAATALAGLDVLDGMQSARLLFEDGQWQVTGTVTDDGLAESARAALSDAGISADITVVPAIVAPEPEPTPLPVADPYRWSASRDDSGNIDFTGYVPVESLKAYLNVRAGEGGSNTTELAAGAPQGFAADVVAALAALDTLESGTISYDGAAWSLDGRAADQAGMDRAVAALGDRANGWSVTIAVPEPPPVPVERGAADYAFAAEKHEDGSIAVSGDIPAEATRSFLTLFAGDDAVGALTVRSGAPQDYVLDLMTGIRALDRMDTGRLAYSDFAWQFFGKSASGEDRELSQQELEALAGPPEWTIDIIAPTPLEVCTAEVAAFDERNAILFQSGSARITQESLPALDEIARVLKACETATIVVEGHTDSDGDEESNLILSVARAEAVIDRLVELGIGEGRLYAIGYGESLPVASNDTQDGKRRNRRIVLSVSEGPGLSGIAD